MINYKFCSAYRCFDLQTSAIRLMEYFSKNKHGAAYFFDGETFIGWLSYEKFAAHNHSFSVSLLDRSAIAEFYDYKKDHDKIRTFFEKNRGIENALVINRGKPCGEFQILGGYKTDFYCAKKIAALKTIGLYLDEIHALCQLLGVQNIGILAGEEEAKYIPGEFIVVRDLQFDGFDIILDAMMRQEIAACFQTEKIVPIDEFLFCALLLSIKTKTSDLDRCLFFNVPQSSAELGPLYEDELAQSQMVKNLRLALSDPKYLEKVYEGYPADLDRILKIGAAIHNSVIYRNNGVYTRVAVSKLNDFADNVRITPSNRKYNDKIYVFGPCIVYSLFTTPENTVTELIQRALNEGGHGYDAVNMGVPNGYDPLNDLLRMIYLNDTESSYNVFINGFSHLTASFIRRIGGQIIDVSPAFKGLHYFFVDSVLHYGPKGNHALAREILKYLPPDRARPSFSPLTYLRKKEPDDRYYLKECDVEKYRGYLRANAFPGEGKTGFIEMNAGPFTNGHAYLIDYAVRHCDRLYVFVVEDNPNSLPVYDRLCMVKEYCQKYDRVKVLSGSHFLGSKYTIPAYFDKTMEYGFDASEDIRNFDEIVCPILNVDVRFMGEEPDSPVTRELNESYRRYMTAIGKQLVVIPRLKYGGKIISASSVRKALSAGDMDTVSNLVPSHVYDYLSRLSADESI